MHYLTKIKRVFVKGQLLNGLIYHYKFSIKPLTIVYIVFTKGEIFLPYFEKEIQRGATTHFVIPTYLVAYNSVSSFSSKLLVSIK